MTKNLAGRKQNLSLMSKKLMTLVDLGEPTSRLDHVHSTWMQIERKSHWGIQKDVRIQSNWRGTRLWKIAREHDRLVLMTWKVMWSNAWNDIANWRTQQLSNYLRSPHRVLMTINSKKKNGNGWRIAKSLLSNRPEMPFWDRAGRPDIFLVCKQTGTSCHKMDQSLWQRLARLMSYEHNTSDCRHTMCVIRHSVVDRDCSKTQTLLGPWRFESNLGRNSGCLRKSNIRSHELEVQERNLSVSQFDWIWSYFLGRWSSHGPYPRSRSLGSGCWSIAIFQEPTSTGRPVTKPKGNTPTPRRRNTSTEMMLR